MTATISSVVGTAAYRGGALREDLAGFISNISRDERPLISSIGQTSATLPRHEWQTDTLAAPAANAQNESFVFNTDNNEDITTTRLSNYTQVFGKTVDISGSLLESTPAGASDWFAYSMKKRGRELMRDVEYQAVRYDPSDSTEAANIVYKDTDARHFGSVYSYTGNWVRAAATTVEANNAAGTGTAITSTQGVGFNTTLTDGSQVVQYTAAPTDVQLTSLHISSLLETMYESGGRPNAAQIPSGLKTRTSEVFIAGNAGAAQRRAEAMSNKVNLAVDSVLTEFGFDIALMPNYVMQNFSGAESSVFIYDTDMIKKAVLKGMAIVKDQQARYGEAAIMFEECTLEVKNPNSLGAVIGVKATA